MTKGLPPRIEIVGGAAALPASDIPPPEAETPVEEAQDASAAPAPPRVRIEIVDQTADRLRFDQPARDDAAEPKRFHTGWLLLAGSLVLLGGLPAVAAFGLVVEQFGRSQALGWLTLAILGLGAALLLLGLLREWSALRALDDVDRLRRVLGGADDVAKMAAAQRWAVTVGASAPLTAALATMNDPDAAVALLRTGPGASLRAKADRLGWQAAAQVAAGIAAVPSPALDVLLVTWRGLRLLRQISALYRLRPGILATLALMRRTAMAATAVGVAEVAANAAANALLSNVLVTHLAGEVAGSGIAARRMLVLARATAAACDPLPPP